MVASGAPRPSNTIADRLVGGWRGELALRHARLWRAHRRLQDSARPFYSQNTQARTIFSVMSQIPSHVVNVDEVEETDCRSGDYWGGFDKQLTPSMRPRGGRLGVNQSRLPRGHTMCPFHYHEREDEVFFIISGRGVLHYGEDLVYLSIGPHDPHEVCVYPDSNKMMVRSQSYVGFIEKRPYTEGEPLPPAILGL